MTYDEFTVITKG